MKPPYRNRLLQHFHQQVTFARDYSPLYAALFGLAADWLAAESDPLAQYRDRTVPEIVGRFGCDLFPFALDTAEAERTLMSYVWADQGARLQRLQEGIAAFRAVQAGDVPIQLSRVDLPDELGSFLHSTIPGDSCPVVIYNTFMTIYLSDKGASFRGTIAQWAADQSQPVFWLQWEPIRDMPEGSEYGWCGWTADLWQGGSHKQWFLGWVHPHGTHIRFTESLQNSPL